MLYLKFMPSENQFNITDIATKFKSHRAGCILCKDLVVDDLRPTFSFFCCVVLKINFGKETKMYF